MIENNYNLRPKNSIPKLINTEKKHLKNNLALIKCIYGEIMMLNSKITKGKIFYSFLSDATKNNAATGVKRIANICHNNNIPVSWVVDQRTAENLKDIFVNFIEKYNDNFVFKLQSENPLFDNPGMGSKRINFDEIDDLDKYIVLIKNQKEKIENILGIAPLKIAQLNTVNKKYIDALKILDFEGVWGVNFVIDQQNILKFNQGAPFGIYYINNNYCIPFDNKTENDDNLNNNNKNKILAVEKSFRDINKGYFSNKPQNYTSELLEICKQGICNKNDISYMKHIVDQYIKNSEHNRLVPMIHHQAAHEMEYTMTNHSIQLPTEIDNMTIVLDKIFKYIKIHDEIKIVSLYEMISSFKKEFPFENIAKHFYFIDKPVMSLEFYKKRTSKWNKRKYHFKRLKYLIKRIINKANFIDIPEKFPKNGKSFPPLYIFQNISTKIFFEFNLQNDLETLISPRMQYLYHEYGIIKNENKLKILEQNIISADGEFSVSLKIESSAKFPWGILLRKKISFAEIDSDNNKIVEDFNKNSFLADNFAFFYLYLSIGVNSFKINGKI